MHRVLLFLRTGGARLVAVGLTAALVGAGATWATATPRAAAPISACAAKSGGALRLLTTTRCKGSERKVTWAARGPAGPAGRTGPRGLPGEPGTLATVPFDIIEVATGTERVVNGPEDITLRTECGSSRIGSLRANAYVPRGFVSGSWVSREFETATPTMTTGVAYGDNQEDVGALITNDSGSATYHGESAFNGTITTASGRVVLLTLSYSRDYRSDIPWKCRFTGTFADTGQKVPVP